VANDAAKIALVEKVYAEANKEKFTFTKKNITNKLRKVMSYCEYDYCGSVNDTINSNLFVAVFNAQDVNLPVKVKLKAHNGKVIATLDGSRKVTYSFVKQGNSYKISAIN
jgi:hypothetical protein